MQDTWVGSLGAEIPWSRKYHSSILAWEIPWTEEPGGLRFMGSQRVGHNWVWVCAWNQQPCPFTHCWRFGGLCSSCFKLLLPLNSCSVSCVLPSATGFFHLPHINIDAEQLALLRYRHRAPVYCRVVVQLWGHRGHRRWNVSHSVMSNSLPPHGLYPAKLLCPWNFPGKNAGVGCHSLLQGIFLTQGLNLALLHCSRFFTVWATRDCFAAQQTIE